MKSTLRLALTAVTLICCRGTALGNGIGVTLFGANSFDSLDASDGVRDDVFHISGNLALETGASILCNDLGPSGSGACPISILTYTGAETPRRRFDADLRRTDLTSSVQRGAWREVRDDAPFGV